MSDKKQIIIEPRTCVINRDVRYEYPYFFIREYIPKGYDITGIHVDFTNNPNLDSVIIDFSNFSLCFTRDMEEYMKTFPLYLTLSKYLEFIIRFVYNKDFLNENIELEMVDEYVHEYEYSEEVVTIFDGDEYHTGNIATKKTVPSGRKISKTVKGAQVETPVIVFDILKKEHKNEFLVQPVKQLLNGIDKLDKDYIKILTENHNLTLINNNTGYIDNNLRYISGLVGLEYTF